jgi:Fe2+ transport system protein FeoA
MNEITCAMCGHTFDSAQHRGCAACPLQPGCQLACCPNCGYEAVDPSQSVLASAFANFLRKLSREKPNMQGINTKNKSQPDPSLAKSTIAAGRRLTDLCAGSKARILGFAPDISIERKAQLQAYGVIPGNSLWVQQQKPVTVIQVEHTELAFETELADSIFMERL